MPITTKNEFKVGLFVFTTLILIFSNILYIAYKKDVFSKANTFTLSSKSGEDLSVGMPVVFSGFKIGILNSLELNEKGVVLIQISIPERHTKWLRTDSVFVLDKPLIGSPQIRVYTDELRSPVLSPEETPEVIHIDSINEAVQKFQPSLDKVDKILENMAVISSTLSGKKTLLEMILGNKESVTSINDIVKKTKHMSDNIDSILQNVDSMTTKADQKIFKENGPFCMANIILKDIIFKLKKLDVVAEDLPKIITSVSDSTEDLDTLRKDIDMVIDSSTSLIKRIEKIVPLHEKKEIVLP